MGDTAEGGGGVGETQPSGTVGESAGGYDYRKLHNFPLVKVSLSV